MADRLLESRNKAKKNKPTFVLKESHSTARIKARWRFPRGKHSRVRQVQRGRPPMPTPGYGSPKAVKGLHRSGVEMVLVHNAEELNQLTENQGAVLAKVGAKKRLELLELAQDKKITVINAKDLAKKIKSLKEGLEERRKSKQKKLAEMSKKEEDKKKKAEEKKKKDEEAKKEEAKSEEDSKEEVRSAEKKQKEIVEKTITKKQ